MRLGFYLNSVARLRDPEKGGEPEPAVVASLAMSAGAHAILAGWSKSGGVLKERDIRLIRELIHGDLVLIAPLGEDLVEPVIKFKPEGVILVASGWDGIRDFRSLQMEVDANEISTVTSLYRAAGVTTNVLLDPDPNALKVAVRCEVSGVVLDASQYGAARSDEEAEAALDKLADSAMMSHKFGMVTAVSHGLNYQNIGPIAALHYIEELYVGRAIVARALINGIDRAVSEIMNTIDRYRTVG